MSPVAALALGPALLTLLWFASATAQTLQATNAIQERECGSFLGIFEKCTTIQTNIIHRVFTQEWFGKDLFRDSRATASHCTRVDGEQKCQRSVSVVSDRSWDRVLWGRSNQFIESYGEWGTREAGPGHLRGPAGLDITRREGEWHVVFIADMLNDRVVVLAVGYDCRCEKWLGTLDGTESGTPLATPTDVAWDDNYYWTLTDDRVFIVDTGNDRILVYQVGLDPVNGTMTKEYLGEFGSRGSGPDQFLRPQGIAVRSNLVPESCVFEGGHFNCTFTTATAIYISDSGNERVSYWTRSSSFSPTSRRCQEARNHRARFRSPGRGVRASPDSRLRSGRAARARPDG